MLTGLALDFSGSQIFDGFQIHGARGWCSFLLRNRRHKRELFSEPWLPIPMRWSTTRKRHPDLALPAYLLFDSEVNAESGSTKTKL
jgi:hypothetical protein